ncbi:hypothetical protein F2Q68_00005316 [Brassica cretica]|uniref:Uncharacterized protein n=1 Tax=Brassica cretica TaxID=69181 RepID=A0A8S9J9E0_BRACR|nr:hypothetical protein F2Q68_00005316 [Brassica cretica]
MEDLSRKSKASFEELCLKQDETMRNPTQQNMRAESEAYKRSHNLKTSVSWLNDMVKGIRKLRLNQNRTSSLTWGQLVASSSQLGGVFWSKPVWPVPSGYQAVPTAHVGRWSRVQPGPNQGLAKGYRSWFSMEKLPRSSWAVKGPVGSMCKLAGFLKTLEYWPGDKFWDLVSGWLILCLEMLETSVLGLGQDLGLITALGGAMTTSTYVSRIVFDLIPSRFKVRKMFSAYVTCMDVFTQRAKDVVGQGLYHGRRSLRGLIQNQYGVSCGTIACSDVTEGTKRRSHVKASAGRSSEGMEKTDSTGGGGARQFTGPVMEDEVVKLTQHARAIRDVEDEELRRFFFGMSPWQFDRRRALLPCCCTGCSV